MSDTDDAGRRDGGPGDTEETLVEILGFEGESDAEDAAEPKGSAGDTAELAAERERYLRLRADFDNFRKRAERERTEVERYALVEAARQLLPVVDNLERALAASGGASGVEELRRGVEMILRQLEEILKRFGLSAITALGERFDPSIHEAVSHESSGEVAAPTVIAEFQRGYRLNDRLIRPAMVKVALPAGGESREPEEDVSAATGRDEASETDGEPAASKGEA